MKKTDITIYGEKLSNNFDNIISSLFNSYKDLLFNLSETHKHDSYYEFLKESPGFYAHIYWIYKISNHLTTSFLKMLQNDEDYKKGLNLLNELTDHHLVLLNDNIGEDNKFPKSNNNNMMKDDIFSISEMLKIGNDNSLNITVEIDKKDKDTKTSLPIYIFENDSSNDYLNLNLLVENTSKLEYNLFCILSIALTMIQKAFELAIIQFMDDKEYSSKFIGYAEYLLKNNLNDLLTQDSSIDFINSHMDEDVIYDIEEMLQTIYLVNTYSSGKDEILNKIMEEMNNEEEIEKSLQYNEKAYDVIIAGLHEAPIMINDEKVDYCIELSELGSMSLKKLIKLIEDDDRYRTFVAGLNIPDKEGNEYKFPLFGLIFNGKMIRSPHLLEDPDMMINFTYVFNDIISQLEDAGIPSNVIHYGMEVSCRSIEKIYDEKEDVDGDHYIKDSDSAQEAQDFFDKIKDALFGSLQQTKTEDVKIEDPKNNGIFEYADNLKDNLINKYIHPMVNQLQFNRTDYLNMAKEFKKMIDMNYHDYYSDNNKTVFNESFNSLVSESAFIINITSKDYMIEALTLYRNNDGGFTAVRAGDQFLDSNSFRHKHHFRGCNINTKNDINLNIVSISGAYNYDLKYLLEYLNCTSDFDEIMGRQFDIVKWIYSVMYDIFMTYYINYSNCPGEFANSSHYQYINKLEVYDFNNLLNCMEKYVEDEVLNEQDLDNIIETVNNSGRPDLWDNPKMITEQNPSNRIGLELFDGTLGLFNLGEDNMMISSYCKDHDLYLYENSKIFSLERFYDLKNNKSKDDYPDKLITIDSIGNCTNYQFNNDLIKICKYLKSTIKK